MPTYDYECDACGNQLEMFQRMTDEPVKKCPSCGKDKLRRLFGKGAAIVFKGSGFYQTDYRSESYKSAAAKESQDSGTTNDPKSSNKPESTGTSQSAANKPSQDEKPSKLSE